MAGMIWKTTVERFWNGKRVLVVGGSEGIGLAIAVEAASLGAEVGIAGRDPAKREAALALIEKSRRRKEQNLWQLRLNVTDANSTRAALHSVVEEHGTPEVLVNAAGIAHPGYLDASEIDDIRHMIDTNYLGTVYTIKALLPAMRAVGRGWIVNISSMAGFLGLFGYTGYCASKWAVIGFSSALRREVKPYGLRVSVLCPPNTRTPGLERENKMKPPELLAMEQRVRTISAAVVAHSMIRALPRNPFLIHPAVEGKLAYWGSRMAPNVLTDYVLRRRT